ncbi:hypothetical protein AAZX31_15G198000 [Glycine max]|uniref:Polygalacturonase inhibitor 1 n=2 Tax=Glycine soja TaxID=3848 RepID=A0A445GWD5_GLYSO|nr:polygalacturonase inhibitor-like [Glycine soja]KAG4949880.1 hypothetical protein JHK86_043119 [Glycine max]KAG4957375.1 hypothetical protein JHK85_043755 [Glycine max]KAG5106118.1 hypothetical protein JHK82_043088 [Glycine max]KAG5117197.1 hypothetical protein JHK84_043310 [Glycine max]KAH1148156.1 hypothetical protein GYH30_043023 [Glycine max]
MLLMLGLCFLLFSAFPLAFSERCHPQDKKALLQLQKDLGNPYHIISWNAKEDCCEWFCCVKCDEKTNRVISVALSSPFPDTNLSAQIPPSVGDLPYLESLVFHKFPKLVGPIQPAIAKLTKLKYLDLSNNNLSGPIPDFFAQLKNLDDIDLSFNNLSGPIPSSLGKLPKLAYLDLSRNKLTGSIPASFGSFQKPGPAIMLSKNQLSGRLPASLANLDSDRIDLSRNKLEGDASMLFGSNKRTWSLDLSRNNFAFDLSRVEIPHKTLARLDLNHNKIYGSLPVGLTKVEHFQLFDVSYNQLCGLIPKGGELQKIDKSLYSHNKCLCGSPLSPCNHKQMTV